MLLYLSLVCLNKTKNGPRKELNSLFERIACHHSRRLLLVQAAVDIYI